jgi:hypothetical protein
MTVMASSAEQLQVGLDCSNRDRGIFLRLCRLPCGKASPYRAASPSPRLRRRPRHLCTAKPHIHLPLLPKPSSRTPTFSPGFNCTPRSPLLSGPGIAGMQ